MSLGFLEILRVSRVAKGLLRSRVFLGVQRSQEVMVSQLTQLVAHRF